VRKKVYSKQEERGGGRENKEREKGKGGVGGERETDREREVY
jgi:hypothetical protein